MKDVLIKSGQIITAVDNDVSDTLTQYGKISAIGRVRKALCNQLYDATSCLIFPGGVEIHTHLKLPLSDTEIFDTVDLSTRTTVLGETSTIIESTLQQRDKSKNVLKNQFYFAKMPTFLDFSLHLFVIKITTIFQNSINIKNILIFRANRTCPGGMRLDTREIIRVAIFIPMYRSQQTIVANI